MGKHGGGLDVDVEKGGAACMYMIETPELRWAFIRKVYAIVALQLLATIAVAATVYLVPDIRAFFLARTPASLAAFVLILVATILVMIPMMCLRNRHPINLILLGLFTICMSFSVGLGCLSRKGVIIIEAATLTFVVVLSLTIYTFWAAKRSHDFSFLGPFLFAACLILMLFSLIQVICSCNQLTIYPNKDVDADGQSGDDGVRVRLGAGLLRVHHLRHGQPHQEARLRRVCHGGHLAVPRHHQHLHGHSLCPLRLLDISCSCVAAAAAMPCWMRITPNNIRRDKTCREIAVR
ncbi:protein LIFEGUARD 2 isoform X2 [Brachypodium distachyon]|uniref:protein LIFEGUARD 2 isoform X2 n=1 Tax=Brachypodium distachyon TaxID=15368 RepID=UPI00052FDBFC|nr:protein LIFEGUARD 2 isoform X2 [Brachypodium distachyon]|eukprot:XP_010228294.1 protein LIFEGUARD 2 isoform X2 [Brachypodium distachyon]